MSHDCIRFIFNNKTKDAEVCPIGRHKYCAISIKPVRWSTLVGYQYVLKRSPGGFHDEFHDE